VRSTPGDRYIGGAEASEPTGEPTGRQGLPRPQHAVRRYGDDNVRFALLLLLSESFEFKGYVS